MSNETHLQTVTTWHVVVTIDVARGAGIRVVVLGDVAMARWGLGHRRWVVEDGDVAEGEWRGDGRALVVGCWSSLLLGPW